MPPTTYHLRNESGIEVFTGTIVPAPSGGSQPSVIRITYSAADIAARWDGDDVEAAIEVTQITDEMGFFAVVEMTNTLDNNVSSNPCMAYDPGATTADVLSNGDSFGTQLSVSASSYSQFVDLYVGSSSPKTPLSWLVPGKAAYAVFGGDDAPTTGEITLVFLTA